MGRNVKNQTELSQQRNRVTRRSGQTEGFYEGLYKAEKLGTCDLVIYLNMYLLPHSISFGTAQPQGPCGTVAG